MPGTYFANPDCLEPEAPAVTIDDLRERARNAAPTEILLLSPGEFVLISPEVGLGWRWQGRRIIVR